MAKKHRRPQISLPGETREAKADPSIHHRKGEDEAKGPKKRNRPVSPAAPPPSLRAETNIEKRERGSTGRRSGTHPPSSYEESTPATLGTTTTTSTPSADEEGEEDFDLELVYDDLDSDSEKDFRLEEEEEREEEGRRMKAAIARTKRTQDTESDSDDEEEEDEDAYLDDLEEDDEEGEYEDDDVNREKIQVDFGAYDMTDAHVEPMMYLFDQLLPDHLLEVDRDDFAALVKESPYTMVLKVNSGEEDDDDDTKKGQPEPEEEEIHGFTSLIDVAHQLARHPDALKPLIKLLRESCWRTASPGAHPLDLLLDLNHNDRNPSKALWLISEQNRHSVPMEMTVHMVEDMVSRLEEDTKAYKSSAGGTPPVVWASPSCMFLVLAKVQKAMEAPVSSAEKKKAAAAAASSSSAADKKAKKHENDKKGGEEGFDLKKNDIIFWREEDEVFYHFRDKRVAALLYKSRAQYDGQPETERPMSLLFMIPSPTVLRQALESMKRKSTLNPQVTYF